MWMPHGMCYLWTPWMIQWQMAADLGIALAYFLIPFLLYQLTVDRRVRMKSVIWCFAAFITLCGFTHLISIVTIWQPIYVVDALVKTATAIVSLTTVFVLWREMSRLIREVDAAIDSHNSEAIYQLIVRFRGAHR